VALVKPYVALKKKKTKLAGVSANAEKKERRKKICHP
jgi:hypothetical protein